MKKTLGILFFWLVDVPLCLLAAFLVVWAGIISTHSRAKAAGFNDSKGIFEF